MLPKSLKHYCAALLLALLLAACQQTPVIPAAPAPEDTDTFVELDPAALTRWSDPASWTNGRVPLAGEAVYIPKDKGILLDVSPPNLKSLQIDGTLAFARKDLNLTAGYIVLHGRLVIGSPTVPFAQKAIITLNATNLNEDVMKMGTRGILVMGGRLELFGAPVSQWTKINANAATGATTLTLRDDTSWKPGDKVVLAPTDFYPHDGNNNPDHTAVATELLTVASGSGKTLNLTTGLKKSRWGVLQYVNSSGMTTTPTTSVTPLVLDERASVGNLSRNIVIQGADDSVWKTNGFGAQVMIMSGSTKGSITADGVEFRQMGQLGKNRRYPIHWHMLSYSETNGADLGDAAGQYVKNSSIWNSKNRCVVIHGTNGVNFSNNICYDITGHAVFVEDAVERRNVIERNLVLKVRSPADGKRFLAHDEMASGFWLTNPDNIVQGNIAADVQGKGFWLAFPRQTIGLSSKVKLIPYRMMLNKFSTNIAHSSIQGLHLDDAPTRANPGQTVAVMYAPTRDMVDTENDAYYLRPKFENITSFKNGSNWGNGSYHNRVAWPDYVGWVVADNMGANFSGAGLKGVIQNSLVIAESLNKTRAPSNPIPKAGFASYHSTFDITNNVIVGFPFDTRFPGGGAFKTDDYYLSPVEKGMIRNPGNRLINTRPGYRVLPPNMRTDDEPNSNWTLAGAVWDPQGFWGPKNNYWVYNVPFLTSGASCESVAPVGQNGMSCSGEYYGVEDFATNFDTGIRILEGQEVYTGFYAPIEVIRRNSSGGEIGRWTVADGNTSIMLPNMRHFAARPGGIYELRFPGNNPPTYAKVKLSNIFRSSDSFMLGVSLSGSVNLRDVYLTTSYDWNSPDPTYTRRMSAVSSMAQVSASGGDKFFHDKAKNLVWIKVTGGLTYVDTFVPNSDPDLYRYMNLVIR
jgi:hypothetical protein